MKSIKSGVAVVVALVGLSTGAAQAHAEIDIQSLLREGLLGAGVGAISAGVGKGNVGTGALVGAGTNIIGGTLLQFLTSSPSGRSAQPVYGQPTYSQPVYAQPVYSQPVYTAPQPTPTYTYTQPQVTYTQPVAAPEPVYSYAQPVATNYDYNYNQPQTQDETAKKFIKQGILGAGVGALSAGVGKGNAGTGALVGAGTTIIGGALMDFLSGSSNTGGSRTAASQQTAYYYSTPAPTYSTPATSTASSKQAPVRHIVRTFNEKGNVISEDEYWA
jgi:hypothetical protein